MMKSADPSLSGSIRLRQSYWHKLRELMRVTQGRKWLEKAIDREHKKVVQSKEAA